MENVEFMKWLSQGSAASAVIIVVWLFLKQVDGFGKSVSVLTSQFVDALSKSQELYETRLESLHERFDKITTSNAQRIDVLSANAFKSTLDTIILIKELKDTANKLADTVQVQQLKTSEDIFNIVKDLKETTNKLVEVINTLQDKGK